MSSGAPAQVQKYEWNDEMKPRWINFLNNRADRLSERPYQRYQGQTRLADGSMSNPGQRVAGLARGQNEAISNANSLVQLARSPIGAMNAASDQIVGTLQGDYLGQSPHGIGEGGVDAFNPWTHQFRNDQAAMQNQYGGGDKNPYFRQTLQQGMEDITNAYKQGTSADTTRMFNLAGAFGGSAHQNAVANNEAALGKQLGNFSTGMLNQQMDRSAGLDESRIGRMTNAQEGLLSRGNEGWQRAADRDFSGFQSERGRQVGLVGAGQNEQGMAIDRGNWAAQMGGLLQGQNQRMLDQGYQDFADEQNWDYKMADYLMNVYGRAQGGGGMNSTIYGGGPSGGQMGMAGLLALASMFGGK